MSKIGKHRDTRNYPDVAVGVYRLDSLPVPLPRDCGGGGCGRRPLFLLTVPALVLPAAAGDNKHKKSYIVQCAALIGVTWRCH